jgi:hypothetical protein
MKELMVDVVDYCHDFLMELCSPHGAEIIDDLKRRDDLPEWSDPVAAASRSGDANAFPHPRARIFERRSERTGFLWF